MAPPPEIAIPSTSTSDEGSSKPYTLYNITLRLPLRSYVVQKRYSDFARLHATLVDVVGSPPPVALPGKHWIKSTVKSPDLARERQVVLERYLRTIAETPDRRWRDTAAWRAFLNLPSASGSAGNSALSAAGAASRSVGGGAADPGTWLDVHRELKGCLHEARQWLARRDAAAEAGSASAAVAEAGAAAKRALVKAGSLTATLSDGLRRVHESGRLGEGELRRRRDVVSAARMERDVLEKLCNNTPVAAASSGGVGGGGGGRSATQGAASASEKAGLLRGGKAQQQPVPGGRVLGAPLAETDRTRELDNAGVLLLQKQEMAAQDEALEQLAAIIRRQRDMGLQINAEVEAQVEMLDRMEQDATRVQGKVDVANSRIRRM